MGHPRRRYLDSDYYRPPADDGPKSMHLIVSWIEADGSISSAADLPGFDQVPAVGDTIVEPFADGTVDACEVVERYIYFNEENENVWHLILKHVELKPGRREALRILRVIEEPD
jgi:hypothetical protein